MSLQSPASLCLTPLPFFPQGGPKWVGLALTYFSSLTWSLDPENPFAKASLLDLMLDIMMAYQTCLPIHVKLFPGKIIGTPRLQQVSKSYLLAPFPLQARRLPKHMLSEWSHTFLAFFDLVSKTTPLTPGPRVKAESLSQYGYTTYSLPYSGEPSSCLRTHYYYYYYYYYYYPVSFCRL